MKISRRDFVSYSSGFLTSLLPFFDLNASKRSSEIFAPVNDKENNVLVVIHLAGGNDWFNTVIPYANPSYYKSRPNLTIEKNKLLKLNEQLALHPALEGIKHLYDNNQVAVLLNTGRLDHFLSHDRAMKINTAWMRLYAQYVIGNKVSRSSLPSISVEPLFLSDKDSFNPRLVSSELVVSSLCHNKNFELDLDLHYELNKVADRHNSTIAKNGFEDAMNLAAKLIKEDNRAGIYNISLGGFDTHNNQLGKHACLLEMLSRGLYMFQSKLEEVRVADRVLTLVSSEFGRSLEENKNLGTDHGYTNHAIVIGKSVNGSIYGNRNNIGYYDLLGTVLDKWLDCPSESILGQKSKSLSFV